MWNLQSSVSLRTCCSVLIVHSILLTNPVRFRNPDAESSSSMFCIVSKQSPIISATSIKIVVGGGATSFVYCRFRRMCWRLSVNSPSRVFRHLLSPLICFPKSMNELRWKSSRNTESYIFVRRVAAKAKSPTENPNDMLSLRGWKFGSVSCLCVAGRRPCMTDDNNQPTACKLLSWWARSALARVFAECTFLSYNPYV